LGCWNESQIYIALPVQTDANCLRLQIIDKKTALPRNIIFHAHVQATFKVNWKRHF